VDALADGLHAEPEGELAQEMQWLFNEYGLHNAFACWRISSTSARSGGLYAGQEDAVAWALQLQQELEVDLDDDPYAALQDQDFELTVQAFASLLDSGSDAQRKMAKPLDDALRADELSVRYQMLFEVLHTQAERAAQAEGQQGAECRAVRGAV
jgi:hypothetical protein